MLTESKEVKGIVSIWAIPTNAWDDTDETFLYQLRTDESYTEGAVKISEHDVTLQLTEGINIILKAIETLNEAKSVALKNYNERVQMIDERIKKLQMIEYQPAEDTNVIDGESIEL